MKSIGQGMRFLNWLLERKSEGLEDINFLFSVINKLLSGNRKISEFN